MESSSTVRNQVWFTADLDTENAETCRMMYSNDLRSVRLSLGLTQTQAARLVYATEGAWSQWESGSRKINPGLWHLFLLRTRLIALPDAEVVPSSVELRNGTLGRAPVPPLGVPYVSTQSVLQEIIDRKLGRRKLYGQVTYLATVAAFRKRLNGRGEDQFRRAYRSAYMDEHDVSGDAARAERAADAAGQLALDAHLKR